MPPKFSEIGVSGLTQYSGFVHEEILRQLQGTKWRDTLKNMLANDATVNSLNFLFENLVRKVSWQIVAADDSNEAQKGQEFIQEAMFEDMSNNWQDTVSDIISFVPWGWSIQELCYKRRKGYSRNRDISSKFSDGKIGWKRWAGRSQDTLDRWIFDKDDNATAMVQRSGSTGDVFTIPLEKTLHFRTVAHKNNPEGRSIYRGAYRAWYFKSRMENIEAIGTERDLAGLPIMYVDPEILKTAATDDQKALKTQLMTTLKNIKRDENEGALIPSLYDDKGNLIYKLELLATGGRRQLDIGETITRYDRQIFRVALADFIMLGSNAAGSYALSSDKTTLFYNALETFLDSISAEVNRKGIPDLLRLNAMNTDLSPRLEHGEVDKIPLKELIESLEGLNRIGIEFDEEEKGWMKRQTSMPSSKGKIDEQ